MTIVDRMKTNGRGSLSQAVRRSVAKQNQNNLSGELKVEAARTLARLRLAGDRTEANVRMEKDAHGEWRSWLLEECDYGRTYKMLRASKSRLGVLARYGAKTCA